MEAVSQGSDGDDKVAELKEELEARGELNEDWQQGVAAPAAEQRKSAFALGGRCTCSRGPLCLDCDLFLGCRVGVSLSMR